MDLSTTYLGLPLAHPFVVGASPLADDLDTARRLEDHGAAAIRPAVALRRADHVRPLADRTVRRDQLEDVSPDLAESLSSDRPLGWHGLCHHPRLS